MKDSEKIAFAIGGGGLAGIGVWLVARKRGPTVKKAWASIIPYLEAAYYLDPDTGYWVAVSGSHKLVEGHTYGITVSQACTLHYNGYYYELDMGWNEIVWEKA